MKLNQLLSKEISKMLIFIESEIKSMTREALKLIIMQFLI